MAQFLEFKILPLTSYINVESCQVLLSKAFQKTLIAVDRGCALRLLETFWLVQTLH